MVTENKTKQMQRKSKANNISDLWVTSPPSAVATPSPLDGVIAAPFAATQSYDPLDHLSNI